MEDRYPHQDSGQCVDDYWHCILHDDKCCFIPSFKALYQCKIIDEEQGEGNN